MSSARPFDVPSAAAEGAARTLGPAGEPAGENCGHDYGERGRLLENPFLLTALARLSSPDGKRSEVIELLRMVNRALVCEAAGRELPTVHMEVPTRMAADHPVHGVWRGPCVDPATRVVVVDMIRAGIVPAQLCFEMLTCVLPDENVRLDHVTLSRATDKTGHVVGADLGAGKVGGTVEGAILFMPDPMGATGSTVKRTLDYYFEHHGRPSKVICIPTMATPEYVRAVLAIAPEVRIVTARIDRGLSPPDVLAARPGKHWDRERGLDDRSYIVPGAGGMGEILNNAWC